MASPKYFSYFKNIDYAVNANKAGIPNTIKIKDYFNLLRVRDDIYKEDTLYTEYYINDGERPDQISYNEYGTEEFYWIIMQINDITDYYNEWPLSQNELNEFILKKYGSYEAAGDIHHYETVETLDDDGNFVLPGGQTVPKDFLYYYPATLGSEVILSSAPVGVTNQEYEQRLNEQKSKIYIIQKKYIYDIDRDVRNYAFKSNAKVSEIDIRDVMN